MGKRKPTEEELKALVAKRFKENPPDKVWDERPSKKTAIGRAIEKAIIPEDDKKRGKK